MLIRFWGVRGSLPTPITPQQIQSKIMAAIQRATPEDLQTEESRAKFVSNLPTWIFGTTGGNTPCVEIKSGKTEIILDAGTGIRLLGKSKDLPSSGNYNLLFSHFHWDHIQGLPFFDPIYSPETTINVYSPLENTKEILKEQMKHPYYPVPFNNLQSTINFDKINVGEYFYIDDIKVCCCKMSHPGNSYSYAFIKDDKKVVYATDVELKSKDFSNTPEAELVFKNADCIILDSQYTVEEANRKQNWGHSAFCNAVDFAIHWGIKKLYLFHHEPTYDDKKLNSILQAARWYAQYIEHSDVQIYLAKEAQEINL